MPLAKSQSAGLIGLGIQMPGTSNHRIKNTFKESGVDLHMGPPPSQQIAELAEKLRTPGWRVAGVERPVTPLAAEDIVPKNMVQPRIAPAWLKHDRQVLRFYAFFQETVPERSDENSRDRNVSITYHLEDGTLRIQEPRVENSGIPQGAFLKRQHVMRDDGEGLVGPDMFRCGEDVTILGKTFHVTGCDRFTRWFLDQCGIDVGEDEPLRQDLWQQSYRFRQAVEKGGLPLPKAALEAKTLTKFIVGQPPPTKIEQFLLNDRKVLRFKAFWDDQTLYGARIYLVIHYYLADNTVEINEAHCNNSGRDRYPVFMARGPLYKKNYSTALPAMMVPESEPYLPEDFIVGESIEVRRRQVTLYDCDDFTRKFYQDYMGINQWEGKLDVSEKPMRHRKLRPPPHNGIGLPEDSLTNCMMIRPKPPKTDLVRMMTLSGESLRFEAAMVNGEHEDSNRRMIITLHPETDPIQVAVHELQSRNSGHIGGKFREKKRLHNPETGRDFELSDFYVGKVVTIAAQPLQIIRADEHALQFMESQPEVFPVADPHRIAQRVAPLAGFPQLRDEAGIDPDVLKELAADHGVHLVDHEIITLLRRFAVSYESTAPRISGTRVLEAIVG